MGSNGFQDKQLLAIRAGAQAPGIFTMGSSRVPTGSKAYHHPKVAIWCEASLNLDGFRDGFQRVARQAAFRNSCWGPGPTHFYNGFLMGSNGFQGMPPPKVAIWCEAPLNLDGFQKGM